MMTKKPHLSVYLSVALCSYAVGSRATPIAPVDGPPELQAAAQVGIVAEGIAAAPNVEPARDSMWGNEFERYVSFWGVEPLWDSVRSGLDAGGQELVRIWDAQAQTWAALWRSGDAVRTTPTVGREGHATSVALVPAPSILLSQYISTTLVERNGQSRLSIMGGALPPRVQVDIDVAAAEDTSVEVLVQTESEALFLDEDDEIENPEEDEIESPALDALTALVPSDGAAHPWPHTADIDVEELAQRFQGDLESLGSISIGLTSAGRMINAVQVPQGGDAWTVVQPEYAWGAAEVIHAITDAAEVVHEVHPEVEPLRINHISRKNGGHLRPHRSHQAGRDVDLGLYYKSGVDPRTIALRREDAMDLAANWTMLRRLLARSHVELIIVDRRIQSALYNYALSIGEDQAWLNSLFKNGFHSVFRHARSHRDHFHVRFCAPRSQELGLRIQPLLVKVPTQNVVVHRVASGDTLGAIARRYGSSVTLIQKRNGLRGTMIRAGQQLWVPLYGACTTCPTPPPLQVPPLRRPPGEGDVAWLPAASEAGRKTAAF